MRLFSIVMYSIWDDWDDGEFSSCSFFRYLSLCLLLFFAIYVMVFSFPESYGGIHV